jgi:hypothetical protein
VCAQVRESLADLIARSFGASDVALRRGCPGIVPAAGVASMNQADCFEALGYVRAAVCHFIEHTQCLEVVCRISEEAAIPKGSGGSRGIAV